MLNTHHKKGLCFDSKSDLQFEINKNINKFCEN